MRRSTCGFYVVFFLIIMFLSIVGGFTVYINTGIIDRHNTLILFLSFCLSIGVVFILSFILAGISFVFKVSEQTITYFMPIVLLFGLLLSTIGIYIGIARNTDILHKSPVVTRIPTLSSAEQSEIEIQIRELEATATANSIAATRVFEITQTSEAQTIDQATSRANATATAELQNVQTREAIEFARTQQALFQATLDYLSTMVASGDGASNLATAQAVLNTTGTASSTVLNVPPTSTPTPNMIETQIIQLNMTLIPSYENGGAEIEDSKAKGIRNSFVADPLFQFCVATTIGIISLILGYLQVRNSKR